MPVWLEGERPLNSYLQSYFSTSASTGSCYLYNACRRYDQDVDGRLSKEELHELLAAVNHEWPVHKVRRLSGEGEIGDSGLSASLEPKGLTLVWPSAAKTLRSRM